MIERYEFAKSLIKEAGEFLLKEKRYSKAVESKAINDYATLADKECERLIEKLIKKSFPHDGLYGEESGVDRGDNDYIWIIDPIDGTVNYMNDFPLYTISIALEYKKEIVMGCVYVPEYDELFSALKGHGAFLNNNKISVSKECDKKKLLAICVPPHRIHSLLDYYMERYVKILKAYSDLRSLGSAALSMCYVAAGRACLYYELGLHIYDLASGMIILKEAGGVYSTTKRDGDMIDIKASVPQFYDSLMELTL